MPADLHLQLARASRRWPRSPEVTAKKRRPKLRQLAAGTNPRFFVVKFDRFGNSRGMSLEATPVIVDGKTYSGEYFVTLAGAIVVHSDFGNAVVAGSLIDDKEAARTALRGLIAGKQRQSTQRSFDFP